MRATPLRELIPHGHSLTQFLIARYGRWMYALVMSSADTTLNAVSSIVAVDVGRLLPKVSAAALLRLSRWTALLMAVPVMLVAAQGYPVAVIALLRLVRPKRRTVRSDTFPR